MANWGADRFQVFETLLGKLNSLQGNFAARESIGRGFRRRLSFDQRPDENDDTKDAIWRDVWTHRSTSFDFDAYRDAYRRPDVTRGETLPDTSTALSRTAAVTDAAVSPAAAASSNAGDSNRPGFLRLSSSSADGFVSGAKVTASVRDRDGVESVTYQWRIREDGQWRDISGANGPTLTLDDDVAGHRLRVIATYVDGRGQGSTVARSFTVKAAAAPEAPAAPSPEPPAAPAPEPPPAPQPPAPPPNSPGVLTVSAAQGSFTEGVTVTARVTDADGAGSVTYQWQKRSASGVWQNLATGPSYTIGYTDGGSDLRVLANYTDGKGHAEALQYVFRPLDVDRPGDLTLASSSDRGFVVGATITATVTDPDGLGSVSYQWATKTASGQWQPIAGATGRSYTLTNNDAAKELSVTAKYLDLQGHDSSLTDPFVVAPLPTQPSPAPTAPPAPQPGTSTPNLLLGVNLAGGEFGTKKPGTYGVDYIFPSTKDIDYYASKGIEVIRLPFLWERIQPTQFGPLNNTDLARIDELVDYARSKGIMVVLDVHNYGKGHGGYLIGSPQVPNSAFADLWGKLATYFKNDSNVMFGLMNEPYEQTAAQWLVSVNAAIAAIRGAGATQKILVPGSYWDGAWSWVSSDNDTVIGTGVIDPLKNYAFEVHQYLDSDGSGTSSSVVSATIGVERLVDVTQWAKQTGNQLFLGEFGVAQNQTALKALDNMLSYMHQHQDVWLGATYWAGGPWWGNYMFSIEVANGVDKPQMGILEKYL